MEQDPQRFRKITLAILVDPGPCSRKEGWNRRADSPAEGKEQILDTSQRVTRWTGALVAPLRNL